MNYSVCRLTSRVYHDIGLSANGNEIGRGIWSFQSVSLLTVFKLVSRAKITAQITSHNLRTLRSYTKS